MSVRRLWGWEPAEVTTDAAGAVVSVTVREPEFSPDDVALMLAVQRKDAEAYNGEFSWADVMDPANAGRFHVTRKTNHAEKAIQDARDFDRDSKKPTSGVVYGVTRAPATRSEQIRQMMRG